MHLGTEKEHIKKLKRAFKVKEEVGLKQRGIHDKNK